MSLKQLVALSDETAHCRTRHKRAAWATLTCIGVIAAAGCSPNTSATTKVDGNSTAGLNLTQAQLKHIDLYTVTPGTYQPVLHVTGTAGYDRHQTTHIAAPISGLVTKVAVTQGDNVNQGQILARVDSPDYAQAIGTYRQALVAARNKRKLAAQARDLLKHQGISAKDAAAAQSAALTAEAQRDVSLRKLQALNVPQAVIKAIQNGQPVKSSGGAIRAPIAGTIVARSISPGQRIDAGSTACFTIADLSRMWVEARLFGSDIQTVHPGDSASIRLATSNQLLKGKVSTVSAAIDPATGAATARIEVANPQQDLRKQMYVRVAIQLGAPTNGLLIPVSAILRDSDNRPFVYVAISRGRFKRQTVKLGYRNHNKVAIKSGLASGQKIVAHGGLFLRFMQNQ